MTAYIHPMNEHAVDSWHSQWT